MNLRPPGPQPGALPDCATPRDPSILRSFNTSAVRPSYEHMFVPDKTERLRHCERYCNRSRWPSSPGIGGKRPARQLPSPMSGCIQTRALCGPPRALHRQCVASKARADRRAHGLPHRVLPRAAVRRLRRDRPSGPRVRPHRAQELQHLRGHPRPQWQSVLDEIERCEVVCTNCHRRRTALRAGFVRALGQNQAGRY